MINIELSEQEVQFLYENIAQMSVPVTNPQGELIHSLAQSCLRKIKAAVEDDITLEVE